MLVITVYLVISGIPAILEIGLWDFLFGDTWDPASSDPKFGILPFILSSIYGTAGALVLGVPIGFLTAVFLTKKASTKVKEIMSGAVSLLAGIPSVVYGLVGMMVLVPGIRDLFGLPDGASLMAAIVVLAFDVTEQVNAQRNRQEFTANVSHELKTPLQSILNSAQLLQSGLEKPEDMQKFTGYICSEADRLLQLINDIIRLSQLDEGGEYPKENVELYQVCSQVLQTLLPAADQRNVTVELLGDEVVIPGIRQLAYELIYNLCDNTIRYNKDSGKVTVTVKGRSVIV